MSERVEFSLQIVKLPDSEKNAPGYTQNVMLCNCFSPLVIRLDGITCGFVADKGRNSKHECQGQICIYLNSSWAFNFWIMTLLLPTNECIKSHARIYFNLEPRTCSAASGCPSDGVKVGSLYKAGALECRFGAIFVPAQILTITAVRPGCECNKSKLSSESLQTFAGTTANHVSGP